LEAAAPAISNRTQPLATIKPSIRHLNTVKRREAQQVFDGFFASWNGAQPGIACRSGANLWPVNVPPAFPGWHVTNSLISDRNKRRFMAA